VHSTYRAHHVLDAICISARELVALLAKEIQLECGHASNLLRTSCLVVGVDIHFREDCLVFVLLSHLLVDGCNL